jgi:hypothetical protein
MIKFDIEIVDSSGDIWLLKDVDAYFTRDNAIGVQIKEKIAGAEKDGIFQPDRVITHEQLYFGPRRVSVTSKEV